MLQTSLETHQGGLFSAILSGSSRRRSLGVDAPGRSRDPTGSYRPARRMGTRNRAQRRSGRRIAPGPAGRRTSFPRRVLRRWLRARGKPIFRPGRQPGPEEIRAHARTLPVELLRGGAQAAQDRLGERERDLSLSREDAVGPGRAQGGKLAEIARARQDPDLRAELPRETDDVLGALEAGRAEDDAPRGPDPGRLQGLGFARI